jgi:hypothetical protein
VSSDIALEYSMEIDLGAKGKRYSAAHDTPQNTKLSSVAPQPEAQSFKLGS